MKNVYIIHKIYDTGSQVTHRVFSSMKKAKSEIEELEAMWKGLGRAWSVTVSLAHGATMYNVYSLPSDDVPTFRYWIEKVEVE